MTVELPKIMGSSYNRIPSKSDAIYKRAYRMLNGMFEAGDIFESEGEFIVWVKHCVRVGIFAVFTLQRAPSSLVQLEDFLSLVSPEYNDVRTYHDRIVITRFDGNNESDITIVPLL